MTSGSKQRRYDVVIVGGGHNGLVSATYLAKAGLSVLLLERLDQTGGAAISAPVFSGLDARLSRYSYLVSLLPEQIIEDLDLRLEPGRAGPRRTPRWSATGSTPACSSSGPRAR